MVEKKYRVLRIIGTLWKILAWVVLVLGVLGAIGSLIFSFVGDNAMWENLGVPPIVGGAAMGIVGFLFALFFTVIYFLTLYAAGEFIYLFLDIEENTRVTREWAQSQVYTPEIR